MTVEEVLQTIINGAVAIMQLQIPVGQYSISFWALMLITTLFGLVAWFIGGVIVGRGGE